MIAILHKWGQNLSLHPHLHCIVPAGGVNENKKNERYTRKEIILTKKKEKRKAEV